MQALLADLLDGAVDGEVVQTDFTQIGRDVELVQDVLVLERSENERRDAQRSSSVTNGKIEALLLDVLSNRLVAGVLSEWHTLGDDLSEVVTAVHRQRLGCDLFHVAGNGSAILGEETLVWMK